jgi:NAD(P)-dependent dehydrogenase (short-subunit alcohol dehydrogenase family)
MQIQGQTALVTGANRGLGRHIAEQLRDRGVSVYAGARNPDSVDLAGVTPVAIDVTDPDSIARAAAATENVSILVNNAGSNFKQPLVNGDLAQIRAELETHFFGPLLVTRAFQSQLAEHDESAILNVLSALSWLTLPGSSAYSAAKAAEWSLSNGLRLELAAQGTLVTGLHVGYMETDMTAGIDAPKADPASIAAQAIDAIESGSPEVLADDTSRQVQAGLAGGVPALYPQLVAA